MLLTKPSHQLAGNDEIVPVTKRTLNRSYVLCLIRLSSRGASHSVMNIEIGLVEHSGTVEFINA